MSESAQVFNCLMLQLARGARMLTQQELAEKTRISQAKLSKLEHGLLSPTPDDLEALSKELQYPIEFFYEPIVPRGFPPYHHRKRKSLSARTLDSIHAAMNIRRMHVSKLIRSLDSDIARPLPRYDLDEVAGEVGDVARVVREHLGLPRGPVANVVEALESAGVIIVFCEFGTTKLDALSQWDEGLPPLVFANCLVPGDRQRYSLAHELGHIVLHSLRPIPNDEEMEAQADLFAAEFLMPEDDIKSSLFNLSLSKLARLKEIWKVSMQALLVRARNLHAISKAEYEYLWKQISRAGYRLREPIEIAREESKALKRMIDFHMKDLNYSISDLARLLRLKASEFTKTYLGFEQHLKLVSVN